MQVFKYRIIVEQNDVNDVKIHNCSSPPISAVPNLFFAPRTGLMLIQYFTDRPFNKVLYVADI